MDTLFYTLSNLLANYTLIRLSRTTMQLFKLIALQYLSKIRKMIKSKDMLCVLREVFFN